MPRKPSIGHRLERLFTMRPVEPARLAKIDKLARGEIPRYFALSERLDQDDPTQALSETSSRLHRVCTGFLRAMHPAQDDGVFRDLTVVVE